MYCICSAGDLLPDVRPVPVEEPGLIRIVPSAEEYTPVPMASQNIGMMQYLNRNTINKGIAGRKQGQEKVLSTSEGKETLFLGQFMAFKVNTQSKTIEYIAPTYSLNTLCLQALNIVPLWMRDDLRIKFRELNSKGLDDDYAQLIIDAAAVSQQIVDETAFQVAHLSVNTLADSRLDKKDLLTRNALMIYNTADSLKYVRLKEYGSFESGDYYTTTEYRIRDGADGDVKWAEIPRDYYYWYVVMPKVYQEGVYEKDLAGSTQQRTYGCFWRDYIWNNPNSAYDYTKVNMTTSKGTISTIPRFGEIIQKPELLWDRELKYYPFNRPFADGDDALNVVGNWASRAIPVDAVDNRPVQPNQALYEHNGNCGEDAYLVAAACRTALIPIVHLNTSCEDHALGAIWESDWQHYEFFRGGLAEKGNSFYGITNLLWGGSYGWTTSMVEGTRPDGFLNNHTKYYAKNLSTLELTILDEWGAPVDGAHVILYAAPNAYGSGIVACGNAWTNSEGRVQVTVGAGKAYYFKFSHPKLGTLPEGSSVYVLTNQAAAVAGQTYKGISYYQETEMPAINSDYGLTPDTASFGVKLDIAMSEIITSVNSDDVQDSKFHYRTSFGKPAVGFFVCDEENYNKYLAGEQFSSYGRTDRCFDSSLAFGLPDDGNTWYVVLTNETSVTNYKEISASCELVETFMDVPHLAQPVLIYPANNATDLDKSFKLTWNPVDGAKSYEIEVASNKVFSIIKAQQDAITATEYTVSGLADSTNYYWHVRAVNEYGTGNWSVPWAFRTRPPKVLAAPTLTEPADEAVNVPAAVTLKWNAVPNAAAYNIVVSEKSFFTTKMVDDTVTETQYALSGLEKGKKYYWKVRMNDGTDSSPWSSIYRFTVGDGNSVEEESALPSLTMVAVRPNPATDSRVAITLESAVNSEGRLSIINSIGAVVYSSEMPLAAGRNDYVWALPQSLPSGVYSIMVEGNGSAVFGRMVLVR